jgi:hypothetical protein
VFRRLVSRSIDLPRERRIVRGSAASIRRARGVGNGGGAGRKEGDVVR